MSETRRISGEIVFPPNAPSGTAARVLLELRDVSMQDEASVVLAKMVLRKVAVGPNARVPFEFMAPTADSGRLLSMRVQVDMDNEGSSATGDLLSTVAISVPVSGEVKSISAPVTKL
jgi:putative lipoprotein